MSYNVFIKICQLEDLFGFIVLVIFIALYYVTLSVAFWNYSSSLFFSIKFLIFVVLSI